VKHFGGKVSTVAVIIVLLVVGVGALKAVPKATANSTTTIGPRPNSAFVEPNGTTTVYISVTDVVALYGADCRLAFDPDVVTVVDADTGHSGIQIEPLSDLMEPDWVLSNTADNENGTIWYAATQVTPTMPVSGSGALAAIEFRAGSATGSSPITVTYQKLVHEDGTQVTATSESGVIWVGPSVPTLRIEKAGTETARLSWTEAVGATSYNVYRGTTPYFTPNEPPHATTQALTYDDVGALGDSSANYFYVVKAVSSAGTKSAASNRVGEFDYDMTPGTSLERKYNFIGVPLATVGVTNAKSLAAYIGDGVYMTIQHEATTQSMLWWLAELGLGTNFAVETGHPYFLHLTDEAATVLTFTGDVPAVGSTRFNLSRPSSGESCKYNFITLPFDKTAVTTANQLGADIGGVYMVLKYHAPTQSIVWWLPDISGGTNFTVRTGYPYIVCLKETAPSRWP
jgi:hypothetical protein